MCARGIHRCAGGRAKSTKRDPVSLYDSRTRGWRRVATWNAWGRTGASGGQRRSVACKGEFGGSRVLIEEWEWRGGQGGAELAATATPSARDIERCRLVGSSMCERLNERIRGHCDSLVGRIPVDPNIPAEVDEIVRTVVTEVNPEVVILFGSRARGDARRDSDLDLVVVESQPFGSGRSAHDEEVRLLRAVGRFDVDADVLACSRDDCD